MRDFKLFVIPLLLVLSFALVSGGPGLDADEEEAAEVKQKVHFASIEAKAVENETEITWKGTFSAALRQELEKLAAKKGYTFFRVVKDGVLELSSKTPAEYRLDDNYDYYFKSIVDSVKTWRDHEDVEHQYVEISGSIVLRQDGKEKTTAKIKFGREVGCYYLLNFIKFYKQDDGEGNIAKTDLVLAIAPQE